MNVGNDYVPNFYPTLQQIQNSNSVNTLLLWFERIIILQYDCVFGQDSMDSSLKLAKLRYCEIAKKNITYRLHYSCKSKQ